MTIRDGRPILNIPSHRPAAIAIFGQGGRRASVRIVGARRICWTWGHGLKLPFFHLCEGCAALEDRIYPDG